MCAVCQAAMAVAAAVGTILPVVPEHEATVAAERSSVVEAAAVAPSAAPVQLVVQDVRVVPSTLKGKCARTGQIRTVKKVRYVCSKLKRWQTTKNTVRLTTTTTAPLSITYARPTQPGISIETCMLREQNTNRSGMLNALPTGFPRSTIAKKEGKVKWALIPVDFPDLPGEQTFRSRVDSQMSLLSEWFAVASEGMFQVEWVVQESWVRLPNPTSEYQIGRSDNLDRVPNGLKLWRDAMSQADNVFDFTGVQTVNFLLPQGQNFLQETSQGFPWDEAVKSFVTNEGAVESFSIPGKFMDQPGRQYWSYWMHEFGHAMAMPHIGSSREPNPFLGLDIMSNQDGESRELSGWMRFVAGWLADDKIYCQDLGITRDAEITLVPLNQSDAGIKMVVIPISETKAVVIESRRETKFSCVMPSKRNGVLAYLYDATLSHGENFLKPIVPSARQNEGSSDCLVAPYPNPILYKGQSIAVEGVTIEVLESLNFDKIRISK